MKSDKEFIEEKAKSLAAMYRCSTDFEESLERHEALATMALLAGLARQGEVQEFRNAYWKINEESKVLVNQIVDLVSENKRLRQSMGHAADLLEDDYFENWDEAVEVLRKSLKIAKVTNEEEA